ncbi:MAG: aKG-HExxH-type peptide beta-hydroxylase, partial [Dehalococcoidia bacterium]
MAHLTHQILSQYSQDGLPCSELDTKDYEARVDWSRIPRPQADGYDTELALMFARAQGCARAHLGGSRQFLDGKVGLVSSAADWSADCVPAPIRHPSVHRASALLSSVWPALYRQAQSLVESVTIYLGTNVSRHSVAATKSSHSIDGFGTITAAINHPVGFAESIAHELAHIKLIYLGVGLESAQRLFRNTREQVFQSPARHDCYRPMTAVIHAQYAVLHVSALDIAAIRAGADGALSRRIAGQSLARHLPWLSFGMGVISGNAVLTGAGARFMAGLCEWCETTLSQGYEILDRFGIPAAQLLHPLPDPGSATDQRHRILRA